MAQPTKPATFLKVRVHDVAAKPSITGLCVGYERDAWRTSQFARHTKTPTLIIEGGTHNGMAPSTDFVARAFLPQLHRMGARIQMAVERLATYQELGDGTCEARPSA